MSSRCRAQLGRVLPDARLGDRYSALGRTRRADTASTEGAVAELGLVRGAAARCGAGREAEGWGAVRGRGCGAGREAEGCGAARPRAAGRSARPRPAGRGESREACGAGREARPARRGENGRAVQRRFVPVRAARPRTVRVWTAQLRVAGPSGTGHPALAPSARQAAPTRPTARRKRVPGREAGRAACCGPGRDGPGAPRCAREHDGPRPARVPDSAARWPPARDGRRTIPCGRGHGGHRAASPVTEPPGQQVRG